MTSATAYFTPSPETMMQLVAQILFSDERDRPSVDFVIVDPTGAEWMPDFPNLIEVTLAPIDRLVVTPAGFEVEGTCRKTGMTGRLAVDTTQDPPAATYREQQSPS